MGIFDRFKKNKVVKEYVDEIAAKLGCECTVLDEKAADAMARYQQALIEGKSKGYTPLIIIPSVMMTDIFPEEMGSEYREDVIAKAKDIDVKGLLKRMLDDALPIEEDEDYDIAGEFEAGEQTNYFISIKEANIEKIILAKIPTDRPWEAAVWVPMGGFNECPLPEEQVAVFKYWHEKYGATPALVTEDVWEFYVENPPKTQKEAESLAWEQFGFCSDIVWQGVGTVNALAGTLINSSVWYFWWD